MMLTLWLFKNPVSSDITIFVPFTCSWLGMLPGSWAYVSAGAFGRAIIQDESEIGLQGHGQLWTLGVGLLFTAVAAAYVTRLAKVMVFCYWYGVWTLHTWQFTNEIPEKRHDLTWC